jgi:hypothetical protein
MTLVNDIIFTRYLYLKDEVEIALLVSLLNNNDDCLFWAFELYFSGFENELLELFWKIYYEFYACLNPTLERYLIQKHNMFLSSSSDEKQKIIATIVENLLIRKYTLDVFMLRQIINNFEIETEDRLEIWLETKNYEEIARFILETVRENDIEGMKSILEISINYFDKKFYSNEDEVKEKKLELKKEKILKEFEKTIYKNKRIILLSKIIYYYHLLYSEKSKIEKSLYAYVNTEDTIIYETIEKIKAYKILSLACICGTNDLKYLSLFKLKREIYKESNIKNEYNYHWEYHASFSPIWKNRIEKYKGFKNHEEKQIEFLNDDLLEEFYSEYGYEPDEQKSIIKEKNIPEITFEKTCKDFYELHKNTGLYSIDENYLCELEKFEL